MRHKSRGWQSLIKRQFDEFFRFVKSGFCPLNPPKLGDLGGAMDW